MFTFSKKWAELNKLSDWKFIMRTSLYIMYYCGNYCCEEVIYINCLISSKNLSWISFPYFFYFLSFVLFFIMYTWNWCLQKIFGSVILSVMETHKNRLHKSETVKPITGKYVSSYGLFGLHYCVLLVCGLCYSYYCWSICFNWCLHRLFNH